MKITKTCRCVVCGANFETVNAYMCDKCLAKDPRSHCPNCKTFNFQIKKKERLYICSSCGYRVKN